MKKIIYVILLILLIGALGVVAFLLMNSDKLLLVGNVVSISDENRYTVTRAYLSDKDEYAKVSTILEHINLSEPALEQGDIAKTLASEGEIVFAPVFTMQVSTPENTTGVYRLIGKVMNGVDQSGEEVLGDFQYQNMQLQVKSSDIAILSAINGIYPDKITNKTAAFPTISEDLSATTIPFSFTNGFDVIFTAEDLVSLEGIKLLFTYDVSSASMLNFSRLSSENFEITLKFVLENDKIKPVFTSSNIVVKDEDIKETTAENN